MTLRYSFNALLTLAVLLVLTSLTGCGDDDGNQPAAKPSGHESEQSQEEHKDHGDEVGDETGEREVHLSSEQANLLAIEVGEAGAGTASGRLVAPATVAFDPDRTARVGPRLPAKVAEVLVDLGDTVQPKTPLAVMESVELGRAKADYLVAGARLESARAAYEREQSLAKQQISSEAELLQAKSDFHEARANHRAAIETLKLYGLSEENIDDVGAGDTPLSRFTLYATTAGTIQRRELAPGQTVSASDTPIHIVDTRKMWVMIDAFEKALPSLAPGLTATFRTRALQGQVFEGQTDWISSELDPQSRTLTVRAVVDNPNGRLRAGMSGTASIQTQRAVRYALVPVDAVQRIGEEDLVFVPGEEPGAFRGVPVTLGDEGNGQIEIRNGLSPGDPVVVRGAFDLMSAMTSGSRSASHSH